MPGITSIEEPFPRPSVVGVVNVTPDSFSDGGDTWEPRIAIARGLEQVDGRCRDRRHRRRVDAAGRRAGRRPTRSCGACSAWSRSSSRARRDDLDRHPQRRGRAARGGRRRLARQRRLRAAPRPAHGRGGGRRGRRAVPDAHARRRPADDAGRPALRRRRRRRRALPRGAARGGGRRGRARGAHLPRPRHRLRQDASSTTSRCCAGCRGSRDRPPAARRRVAQAFLGASRARAGRRSALAASLAATVEAYRAGASLLRVHDVAETVDALAIVRRHRRRRDDRARDRGARASRCTPTTACASTRRRAGQRFVIDLVLVPRSSRGLRERPARGHRQLQRGRRRRGRDRHPAALRPDRAARRGDRRRAARAAPARAGDGSRAQARGADPPPVRRHRRDCHPHARVGAPERAGCVTDCARARVSRPRSPASHCGTVVERDPPATARSCSSSRRRGGGPCASQRAAPARACASSRATRATRRRSSRRRAASGARVALVDLDLPHAGGLAVLAALAALPDVAPLACTRGRCRSRCGRPSSAGAVGCLAGPVRAAPPRPRACTRPRAASRCSRRR